MKKNILFFYLFIWGSSAFCQTATQEQSNDLTNSLPKVGFITPDAAAFQKNTNIPVDLSTGVPKIDYPFWSWKRNKLSFSLGLSYHAGGNKVDDIAPNTGVGWSLNGISRISRTVKGLPDESVGGYWNTGALPSISSEGYSNSFIDVGIDNNQMSQASTEICFNVYNDPENFGIIDQIAKSTIDGEQDQFSFSLPTGESGKFVISKDFTVTYLEQTNCKIQFDLSSFEVINDDGLKFIFGLQQSQLTKSYNTTQNLPGDPTSSPSEWLLTKIYDPQTGDSIIFEYQQTQTIKFESGFNERQSIVIKKDRYTAGLGAADLLQYNSFVSGNSIISYTNKLISSISFPDGTTLNFGYNHNREDLINDKALTNINVINLKNELIDKFLLEYSYFDCNPGSSILFRESLNNYSKKLRLDKISKVDYNNNKLSTSFLYNNTKMNQVGSKNVDYWGYSVDPNRSNISYIPNIGIEPIDYNSFLNQGDSLGNNAQRYPDIEYAKAGVLEKIIYPTGGFTNFEYENNKAFSTTYNLNKGHFKSIQWDNSNFGITDAVNLPERNASEATLSITVIEPGTRPYIDPNEMQSCFSDWQDNQSLNIVISSTDGSYQQTVQIIYGGVYGSTVKRNISLPLDKNFVITCNYDLSNPCSYMYPFSVSASISYGIPPKEKLAGGIRVKKVSFFDGISNTLVKTYDYNVNNNSSAALIQDPIYTYERSTYQTPYNTPSVNEIGYINWSQITIKSEPSQTITYHNQQPLVYSKVTELTSDGASIVKEFEPEGLYYKPLFPVSISKDYPTLRGYLLKETIKDNTGTIISKTTNTYSKTINDLFSYQNQNLVVAQISTGIGSNTQSYAVKRYFPSFTALDMITNTKNEYANNLQLDVVTNYTYDNITRYPKIITTNNSKGQTVKQEFKYPKDKVNESIYSAMVSNNNISPAIETKKFINNELKETFLLNYSNSFVNGMININSIMKSFNGAALELNSSIDRYDEAGNVTQTTTSDGIITSYIWGYKKQYPVAKIVGKTYTNVISESNINMSLLDLPGSDEILRNELNKLYNLTGCFVSSYVYKPLVGIVSQTDQNKKSIFYEYDSFNRLKVVRDLEGKILKKYDYKYN